MLESPYPKLKQHVTYRFVSSREPSRILQEDLVYNVYSANELCDLGTDVGFSPTELRGFDGWPYGVVVMIKERS